VLDKTLGYSVTNEVLTELVFWNMTQCILVESYRRFNGICLEKGSSRFLRKVGKSITVLHPIRKYFPNLYSSWNMYLEFMSWKFFSQIGKI